MSFIDWIIDNYQWVISIFVGFVSLVVVIIKRRVKVVDFMTSYLEALPGFINEAESFLKSGNDKFSFVLAKSVEFISSITGIDERKIVIDYSNVIKDSIESILSTPQKK